MTADDGAKQIKTNNEQTTIYTTICTTDARNQLIVREEIMEDWGQRWLWLRE